MPFCQAQKAVDLAVVQPLNLLDILIKPILMLPGRESKRLYAGTDEGELYIPLYDGQMCYFIYQVATRRKSKSLFNIIVMVSKSSF